MLQILAYTTFVLAIAYAVLLALIVISWKKRNAYSLEMNSLETDNDLPFISVLIPARNEAEYIVNCVQSVLKQDYPKNKLEVIVIDDHSSDQTVDLVENLIDDRVQLLQLEHFLDKTTTTKAYKKAALNLGVNQSKGNFIITTDADCIMGITWLKSFATAFQNGKEMVLAPVVIQGSGNFLRAFQGLDVAGTMLLTGAAVFWHQPLLANGANFGFAKRLFRDLNGYDGNENEASGDDVFLLHKAVQHDVSKIDFLSNQQALVQTAAAPSWKAFFWQRLRWAGKTSAYRNVYLIGFQALVFLFCLLLWTLVFINLLGYPISLFLILTAWIIKALADSFYLRFAMHTLGRQIWMKWFIPSFFAHSFYVVMIGVLAILPVSVKWKGR